MSARLLQIHALALLRDSWQGRSEQLGLFRELSLVQGHADGVHLLNGTVKVCFEVTVCSESFLDVTCSAVLCVQLDRCKVLNVVCGGCQQAPDGNGQPNSPRLKNMYRTVAVLTCTLNG